MRDVLDMRDMTTAPGRTRRPRERTAPHGALARGFLVDRYVILGFRGAGAMGTVYEAYDPELDRRIALKVLSRGENLIDEMVREARALARVSHPNVVAVHDVGQFVPDPETEGERVFIAMEFVDGVELDIWLEQDHRPWSEVRRVFLAAGRGLAAAHEAGLVHRDFKPSNVLVGDWGVTVVDFGLAVPNAEGEDAATIGAGTPHYMAPEVLSGARPDARADVYSFCVALYEAVYRTSPFTGGEREGLSIAKRRPPRVPRVGAPREVYGLLARGLAPDPDQRIPSMTALLDELDSKPRLRRYAGLIALVSVLALVLWQQLAASTPELEARRRVGEVWSPEARERLTLHTRDAGEGEAHAERVATLLDAYAASWVSTYVDIQRTPLAPSTNSRDARLLCLNERLAAFRAQIAVLTSGHEVAPVRAIDAVLRLPSIALCSDVPSTRTIADAPTDPLILSRVADLEQSLLEIDALERAGLWAQGLDAARKSHAMALELDHEPTLARALLRFGLLEERNGHFDGAEAALLDAAALAERLGDDDTAALAGAEVFWVIGYRARRTGEALLWARHVRALIERPGHDPSNHARFLGYLAIVLEMAGRFAEAEQAFVAALSVNAASQGQSPLLDALHRSGLAGLHAQRGAVLEAQDGLRRAIEEIEHWYGPHHPELTGPLVSLGAVYYRLGAFEDAERALDRAATLVERTLSADHADMGMIQNNLGMVHQRRQNWVEARGHLERALAIYRREYGEVHPNVSLVLTNIAVIHLRQADYRRAADLSLDVLSRIQDRNHVSRIVPLTVLAAAQRKLGRCEEAAAHLDDARALIASQALDLPEEEANVLTVLVRVQRCLRRPEIGLEAGARGLARLQATDPSLQRRTATGRLHLALAELTLDLGEIEAAAEHLEHAAEAGLDADAEMRPRHDLARARLLWERGSRTEARELGLSARAELAAAEPHGSLDLELADRWLEQAKARDTRPGSGPDSRDRTSTIHVARPRPQALQ